MNHQNGLPVITVYIGQFFTVWRYRRIRSTTRSVYINFYHTRMSVVRFYTVAAAVKATISVFKIDEAIGRMHFKMYDRCPGPRRNDLLFIAVHVKHVYWMTNLQIQCCSKNMSAVL